MKKIIILFLCISLSFFSVYSQDNDVYFNKLQQVFKYIDRYYVDSTNIEEMVNKVIINTLKDLDPHSTYIDKKDVAEVNQQLEGSFEGVGIYYNILEDTLVVISPMSDGPAAKVGIKAGDRIVKVDTTYIAGNGVNNEIVKKLLQGSKGSNVTLFVKRKSDSDILEFSLMRDKIPIYSIDAFYHVTEDIAYIRMNKFSATTLAEFKSALEKLDPQKVKHLILDLRDNGGGYLTTAVNMANEFLHNNELIVYTEGKNSKKNEYSATGGGSFRKGRLVILIDEGSASASEILSGAIQDWDRGVLVGRRSFGKGLVQRPYSLTDGSVIRLTISRYYTPTGRLIQKTYEKGTDAYRQDIINRYASGEMMHADSIKFIDSLKYYTLKNKRVVYGAGGIMPDVFVPLDSTDLPKFYSNLIKNGVLNSFIYKYVDSNREILLSKYSKFEDFDTDFVVNESIYNEIVEFAKEESKECADLTLEQFLSYDNKINYQIKALIAKTLWTTNEYHQIVNKHSAAYLKAVEIISDSKSYETILKK